MNGLDTLDLDLFDFLPDVAAQRSYARNLPLTQALTCLRDAVPSALEVVSDLAYNRRTDDRSPSASGDWAYIVCRAGLRHEPRSHWSQPTDGGRAGWNRTPANLTTWSELAALLGDDPRRAELTAWTASLTAPDRWRDITRPRELWPNPEEWHPSTIEGDHTRPGWEARIHAWRTVQAILDDAIAALA